MTSADERGPEKRLHERLTAGDETAPSAIADVYLPTVVRSLCKRFRRPLNDHLVLTATSDAFMSYFQNPGQFNPSKGPLLQFLRIAAERDLLNALEGEARRQLREGGSLVELPVGRTEVSVSAPEPSSPEDQMLLNQESPLVSKAIRLLPEPVDQEILKLMMEGVRETSEYARLLEVHDLPSEHQREVVKRNKDRIKKTLQRHLRSDGV